MFGRIWDGRVADRHTVEWLKVVDKPKRLAIFLDDAEPSGTIGRVRRLINSGRNLIFDNLNNLVEDSRRNRDIFHDPGDVFDGRDENGSEVFGVERAFFGFVPGENVLVFPKNPEHKITFGREQEMCAIEYEVVVALLGETSARPKRRWMRRENRKVT